MALENIRILNARAWVCHYELLCNKLHNFVVSNNTRSWLHSFVGQECGHSSAGPLLQLLSQAAIQGEPCSGSCLKVAWGKHLLPSSCGCWQNAVPGELLTGVSAPSWPLGGGLCHVPGSHPSNNAASSKPASWEGSREHLPERKESQVFVS